MPEKCEGCWLNDSDRENEAVLNLVGQAVTTISRLNSSIEGAIAKHPTMRNNPEDPVITKTFRKFRILSIFNEIDDFTLNRAVSCAKLVTEDRCALFTVVSSKIVVKW